MSILDLTIAEIHEALLKGEVTPLDLTKEAIQRAKDNKDNAFELIIEEDAIARATELSKLPVPKDNYFFGIPYVAKDNFSTKGYETTASSNILNGYVPLFDATVIEALNNAGAILIGKTTLDELAMGGTGTSGHLGTTYNPYDSTHTRLIGGSSCGSATTVAASIVPFALGSDTGDSIRKPASHGGLVGLKPTWGLISRFGLFPFAPSMDHVGFFTRSVKDSALGLDLLAFHDYKDSTSSFREKQTYSDKLDENVNGKKIAIIKNIYTSITDKIIISTFDKQIEKLKSQGAIVEFVDFDIALLRSIYPAYMVISCAESTSNNANLDGIKFGPYGGGNTYSEVIFNARTKGFSPLIKRRFVLGSYSLMRENQNELFLRAQKARRMIVDRCNEIFNEYDAIVLPASPSTAPLEKSSNENVQLDYQIADNWLGMGNFGGFPSITIPLGFEDNLPFGVNVTCKPFDEVNMFNIALNIENNTGFAGLSALNFKEKEGK